MAKSGKIATLFRNLKISTRLLILFLLVATVPLGIAGTITYFNSVETIKQEIVNNLSSQANFRSHQLTDYFEEKIRDLTVLAHNPYLNSAMTKYISAFNSYGTDSPVYKAVDKQFREYFTTFKEAYKYYDVFLISPEGNIVFTITLENDLGTNLKTGPYSNSLLATVYEKAIALTSPEISEFSYYSPSYQLASFVAVPVISQGELLGVIATQIGTYQIEKIGYGYTELGESGEVVLAAKVGNDAVFINELRHDPDSAFKRKVTIGSANAVPIQKAVLGEKGYGSFLDYRGIDVLAAWRYVPELKWGLVVKIDAEEAFSQIAGLKAWFLIIGSLTIVGVGVIALFFSKTISAPITELGKATELMAKGDFSVKAAEETGDEIGALGNTFNLMVVKLRNVYGENERRDWLKSGQNILSEKIRGNQTVSELAENIITFLAEYLDAKTGAFYLVDNKGESLELLGSYAFTSQRGFNSRIGVKEGLAGQAVHAKKIISLTDIPEKYMRISSATIDAVPASLLIVPVVYEDKSIGVIELAVFREFTGAEREFVESVIESIAVGIDSAQSRRTMKELLQNTQKQAEKLLSQQNELRAFNEELEEQTQELQASEEELKTQQEELQVTNEELQEKTQALEKHRETILERNLTLQEIQKDLEQKAEDLETASKYKSEFLANMSHELRTPLNSLLLLSQHLLSNKEGNLNEEQFESASIINTSGKDLLELIDEILDLSKIEAGRMDLNIDQVILAELMEGININFKHIADDRGLKIITSVDENLPESIRTDRQKLDQIIRNLISNAVKFTHEGSVIINIYRPGSDVDLSHSNMSFEKSIAISVTDTGIGIPEDKNADIFKAFQQVDGSTSRQYGGTGLGLSISRELARLLGGEIQLESIEGKGSTFVIFIPEVLLDVLSQKAETTDLYAERRPSLLETKPKPLTEPAPSIIDDRNDIGDNDRVLLVIEDDLKFAEVLRRFSHEKNFKLIHAGDGETGLKLADKYKPDAVILDMYLPGIDGRDVLESLKSNPETRHIPVHIMSVMDKTIDMYKIGAIGHINKPVNMEQLHQAFSSIEDIISRKIKHLLIIEDNDVMRKHMRELIGNSDVEVTEGSTGSDAIKELMSKRFDCVILDLKLPDIFEVLKRLNETKDFIIPPIIIYTGREITREEEYKLQEYASSIIIKGVRSEERLLDETALFLHRIVDNMPPKKKEMISKLYDVGTIFKNKKILLADDDMRNVFAISKILESRGMQVYKAPDGQKALDILNEVPDMDLVLMDIMMPVMDGYETIRRIRSEERFRALPVLAVTAKAMQDDQSKCISAGANDYLVKPINTDKLLSLMRVWLYK